MSSSRSLLATLLVTLGPAASTHWGVSNNLHPSLRAPKFDEAQVGIGQKDMEIQVRISP
jgi:uncharacterized protein (DUF2141 family)